MDITSQRAGISFGDKVLVCGAGPIGLVNVMVARATGASRIVCTDIDDNRLQFASDCGATDVLNVKGLSKEESVSNVLELFGGYKPVAGIECSGSEPSLRMASQCISPGGRERIYRQTPKLTFQHIPGFYCFVVLHIVALFFHVLTQSPCFKTN